MQSSGGVASLGQVADHAAVVTQVDLEKGFVYVNDSSAGFKGLPPQGKGMKVLLGAFSKILYTESAVLLGMVYNFLPFMILPIYTTLIKLDKSYIEAAADLGANPTKTFLKVVLPLSMPGIISGVTMVFIPSTTTFAISQLLGVPGKVNAKSMVWPTTRLSTTFRSKSSMRTRTPLTLTSSMMPR